MVARCYETGVDGPSETITRSVARCRTSRIFPVRRGEPLFVPSGTRHVDKVKGAPEGHRLTP
jgi:hypothetical protein